MNHAQTLLRVGLAAVVQSAAVFAGPAARAVEHAEVCRYCRAAAAALAADASGRQYAPDRQVDVQHIKLDVTPDFAERSVRGTATLRFAPIAKSLETLRLDGVNLRITEVRSSHAVREWSAGAKEVTVTFDAPIPADEQAWVEIDYSAEPHAGLYFRTAAMGHPAGDDHCWTQGEPHEARHWFPCFDYPNERSSTEIICRVPAEMTVVANGRLVEESTSDDGATKTFHWLQEQPHVSYLICFVAGRLESIAGRHGDVPLGFFTQPSRAEHIASGLRDTADIMAFYDREIGVPFPWDKYHQATIADFMWGGMENTSITTLTQRTLYENPDDDHHAARTRGLDAHEMAHQWFGDYVTCKDWSHLWLNEGFATYYALLYEGHTFGRDALLYGLYLDARDEIFLPENVRDHRPIVYRKYRQAGEQFDFRNYPKASWVLHMLRSQVGDEIFRQAVHNYLQRHALGNVESDDLREAFEELTGKPLDRFFDQWLYHGGHPQLTVTYDWDGGERLAHVSVEQTQTTGEDVLEFEFPVTLRFIVDGETFDETVAVTAKKHDFYVRLPGKPQVVRFDPQYSLLAQVTFDKSDELLAADLANRDDAIGRILACEGLAKRPTKGTVQLLREALQNDPFFGVREAAAIALRKIGADDAVAALAESLDQDDVRVRRTVVEQLGLCYHDDALATLLEVAGDEDEMPVVAAAAIVGLGRSSERAAREAVEAALASQSFNNERAIAAFLAIRESNNPRFAPALMRMIDERGNEIDGRDLTEAFVTLAAISQRGRRRDAAYEFLAGYLDSPRDPVKWAAIAALGQLHDPRARTLIEPFAAEGQNERLAAVARGALAALDGQAEFVPDEVRNLRREVRELREAQAELKQTLDELKSKAATDAGPSDAADESGAD